MAKSIAKNTLFIACLTMISKILGFVRDAILAFFYGADGISDAYLVAQTIPEFAFSLVIQAIAVGYIPIYTETVKKKGKLAGERFTNVLLSDAYFLCILLVIVSNAIPELFVKLFATGFNTSTTEIAALFVRIMSIAMLGKSTVSILGVYLQTNGEFIRTALTSIPYDVVIILSIAISAYIENTLLLPIGLVIASFIQIVMIFEKAIKMGFRYRVKLSFREEQIKQMLALFVPVAIGVGANQINTLIDRTLASTISVGGISAMNYANKVDNLMENVLVLSLATVIYPIFSRHVAEKNIDKLARDTMDSINIVCFLMLPCAVGSGIFAIEIITLLFGRGEFDQFAIALTSSAMTCYSVGMPFVAIRAILTRVFYSLKDVRTITINSCISIGINIIGNLILGQYMGISGLALATSISSIFAVVLLINKLRKQIHISIKSIVAENLKVAFGTVAMGMWAFFSYKYLFSSMNLIIALLIEIFTCAALYICLTFSLKVNCLKKLMNKKFTLFINGKK